jgi:hypothetical protein
MGVAALALAAAGSGEIRFPQRSADAPSMVQSARFRESRTLEQHVSRERFRDIHRLRQSGYWI